MQAKELMTPEADLADPSMTIRYATIRLRDDDIGALRVGENDKFVGMVTDRDFVVRGIATERAPGNCTAREVMSEGIYYCFDDDEAETAANVMSEHKVRRLPVLNRDKHLVGVLSLADLARAHTGKQALQTVSEPTREERI